MMASETIIDLKGGLQIPSVGLGTGQLREDIVVDRTLSTAFELGYRHLDTAIGYNNEVFIGKVLKKWFASGKLKREDIFITTKLSSAGIHQDRVESFMKKSLENLQLDYVDLYLVHSPIGTKYVEGQNLPPNQKEIEVGFDHILIWKKMEEQVDAGRTKAIGLSNFNQRQIERILKAARIKPQCLQVELHVDFQQRDLVKFCHKNGIVVVAYAPLGSPGRTLQSRNTTVALQNETVTTIGKKYGKTNAQILLRYLLQRNIAVIPKTSSPERLKENIDIFNFTINESDMKYLDDLDAGENGRIFTFRSDPSVVNHPEYPFPK